jgi:ribosomal protein L7/L12
MQIDIQTRKIDAIKALRTFTQETYGITSGLKECKDFLETLLPDQTVMAQLGAAALKARGAGLRDSDIKFCLQRYGFSF